MGIIGDIIRAGKTAVNKVKSVFTQQPTTVTPEKTLNEEIIGQRMPTINVGPFANTLNNQINTGEIVQAPQTGNVLNFSNSGINALGGSVAGMGAQEDELNGFQKLIKNVSNWNTRTMAQGALQTEYDKNKKGVYVGYNPSLNSVYELRPVDESVFNYTLSTYIDEINKADTYEEQLAARDNFIKNVSGQFVPKRVPLGSSTNKGMSVGGVSRDKFTDEQLNSLMGRNIGPDFTPTEDMIWDYVDTIFDNDEISRSLQDKYKDRLEAGLDEVDLNETEAANAFVEKYTNIAKKDTLNLIRNNITSEQRGAAERNIDEIASDQINRLLTSEMYLKGLRDEAAQTPELQRTQWERDMIYNYDVVWKQLMDKFSNNINDYLLFQLNEGVDDRGQISDALWKFENGRQLNDILRDGLADIAGIEIKGGGPFGALGESLGKVSAIDIMRKFANETAYNYRQGKLKEAGGLFGAQRLRNRFEHGYQQDLGYRLSEEGQMAGRATVKTVNTLLKAPQGERGWNAPSAAFLDADVSVGKLIETDDSPNKRTIKKYALQFGEYTPEGLGASLPDLGLTVVTAGGTTPLLLRHIPTFSKLRNFKRISNAIKEGKTIATTIDNSIKGLERARAIGRQRASINSRNKRIRNIVDRTLSQFAVGQSMDAKLSTFDTEPYSDTSFWLSMGGSLLGDILPEAKDIWGVMRTGLKGGKAWTKGTGVWDLVDFINQSDENALLIARQMGKNTANFSEEDLKNYVRAYATITDAAKRVYENLPDTAKAAADSWTKELMYNYVKQAYLPNSRIGKAVRVLVENQATNPADIIKYLGNVPGTVSIGPYQSVIKLKQGTMAGVQAKEGWYDVALDVVDGGFGNKVSNGFTFKDIQDISKINGYDDVLKNRDRYFRKVTERVKDRGGKNTTRTRWVLSEDGLDKFGLETKNLTLASLGIEISGAENVKEIFKEKMKGLEGMKLSDDTIDALAENGGYNEVVSKIENILC